MLRPLALPPLLVLAGCSVFGDPTGLERTLRAYDDHAVQVAALVVDLDSGATLVRREADRLLRPASTMKLLTTAAICRRNVEGAIETVLVADGAPEGTVTLFGGGDPFLSSDELHGLVRDLRRQGVQRVNKVVVVDPIRGSDRLGEGWMWDDEPAAFMPPLSAVPVDGACATVIARRGADGALTADLQPAQRLVTLAVEGDDGPLQVTRGNWTDINRVQVRGHVDGEHPVRRRISVYDPAQFTAAVLVQALCDETLATPDIETLVDASAARPAEGSPRAVLRRAMPEALARTNKPSDNLGAELLLRHVGALDRERPGLDRGAVARGLDAVRADIAALGFDPTQFRLADGSGVSHYNLVSASLLVAELVDMHRRGGDAFAAFEASLPIAGVDGTLEERMRGTPAEHRVHAKTGTISGASNLAGYVTTTSGRHLAFAILVQNFVGAAAEWRALQDAFCARLAAQ